MLEIIHTSVLLEETIKYLAPRGRNETMLDLTLGEAGHAISFLSKFPDLNYIGVDIDPSIQEVARKRLAKFRKRTLFFTNWSQDFLAVYPENLKRPDTIFADLGISYYHYIKSGMGFSFSTDEPLDMRLDPSSNCTAAQILERNSEHDLADIIYKNSGERFARRIAKTIVQERQKCPITSSLALAELVKRSVPAKYRYGSVHPATRTFMSLRIAVNDEIARLPALLEAALKILKPGGRLGIISFHSLEDRLVKNFFRSKNQDCICPSQAPTCTCAGHRMINILTKKGITPCEEEIRHNPSSRSARLRVAEKILEAA